MMRTPEKLQRRERGLTLIELLIGLALTAMLLLATTSMLQVSSAAGTASKEQLDVQEQLQFAMRRMVQRIETTPSTLLAAKAADNSSGAWLAPALFDLRAGTDSNSLALSETIGGVTTVLAEPVTSFSITSEPVAAGRTVVKVALTVSRPKAANDATVIATASAAVSVRLGAQL